jgi:hypothetical protein
LVEGIVGLFSFLSDNRVSLKQELADIIELFATMLINTKPENMRLLILILSLPLISSAQDFEKSQDIYLKEKYTRYYDRNAGLIIQKVISDSQQIRYELALIIFSRGRESTDFLSRSSAIVFDDKSTIILTDPIYINYFQEGKHQYSVRHILSASELDQLKQKKVENIVVADRKNSLDKWQKEGFMKACQSIERQ